MRTGDTMVETADGDMRLYEAVPDGAPKGAPSGTAAPRGAVVVIQEAFGVNSHIEEVTRRAADAGYHAVAPDLFHRSGPGSVVEYGDFGKVLPHFQQLGDDAAILTDFDAALGHLRSRGFADSQIAIVGFCFGGRVTFLVALRRAIGAAAGFYGGGIVTGRFPQFPALIDEAASLRTPWLGLFGDEDGSIPVDDVEKLRAALVAAPVATEIVRYGGAGHGFHCDQRADFRPDDAADAWERTLAWFARHLH
jgi:carboxymethylenebutenolidase